jgi:hypothetical protein
MSWRGSQWIIEGIWASRLWHGIAEGVGRWVSACVGFFPFVVGVLGSSIWRLFVALFVKARS